MRKENDLFPVCCRSDSVSVESVEHISSISTFVEQLMDAIIRFFLSSILPFAINDHNIFDARKSAGNIN